MRDGLLMDLTALVRLRCCRDAPDVDAVVTLSKAAPVGEFIRRKIIGSRGYDLIA